MTLRNLVLVVIRQHSVTKALVEALGNMRNATYAAVRPRHLCHTSYNA
ncbi:hypothetical protein O7626_00820 [Micromonospora sp. WMMD1102]|nr:hypothetical protein [Micromonospora sp. WMMD1102]MDG4784490.1 hypothetical protein [Micromonospora sp. WMMD1102]